MIYSFFRCFGIITGLPIFALFFKTKCCYEDKSVQDRHIKGGALIISNHYNVLDFAHNMLLVLPRKLYVVASEYSYRNRLISFGMRFWCGIKVDRNTRSMRFIDDSVSELEKGHLVQIFPEGKGTEDGSVAPFKPTYLMIALRSGKPIIPIVTDGAYSFFKRTRVIIGKPILLSELLPNDKPTKEQLAAANAAVYETVLRLKRELTTETKK